MDKKLTLKFDKYVIIRAKEYAESQKRSLSRLVESYLKSLTNTYKDDSNDAIEISPFVKSMQSGVNIPSDFDYKKAYDNYRTEKYL